MNECSIRGNFNAIRSLFLFPFSFSQFSKDTALKKPSRLRLLVERQGERNTSVIRDDELNFKDERERDGGMRI